MYWFFIVLLASLAAWFAWESRRDGGHIHPAIGGLIAVCLAISAAITLLASIGG